MKMDYQFLWHTLILALAGIPISLSITVCSVVFGLIFGFLLFLVKMKNIPFVTKLVSIFISFLRGTPLIVQIFVVFAIFPLILQNIFHYLEISINIYNLNPIYYALIVFGLYAAGIYSEMWKSAFSSVGEKQLEAAYTVGLNGFQAYRHIVGPQAFLVALPSICTSSLNIFKSTSLVFVIGVKDITNIAMIQAGTEYKYVESYLAIFVIYLTVCTFFEFLFKWYERKLSVYKMSI